MKILVAINQKSTLNFDSKKFNFNKKDKLTCLKFSDANDIGLYLDSEYLNFDKIIILDYDAIFLYMYLTKLPKAVVASLCDEHSAHLTGEHNNTNIIIISSIIVGQELANSIINNYLTSHFLGQRHQVRVDMLQQELNYENK